MSEPLPADLESRSDAFLAPFVAGLGNDERALRHQEALSLPATVDLEVSSACDRHCRMCPRDTIRRGAGFLSMRLVNLLSKWLPGDARVMLCGLGEPLMHPDLVRVAALLKGSHRTIGVTTHGERLFAEHIDALLDAGVGLFQVSLHGSDEASMDRVAPGSDFATTLNNLEHLARSARGRARVAITTTTRHEDHATRMQIESLAKDLRVEFFPRLLHHRGGALSGGPEATDSRRRAGCGIFARITFITWQGDVLACCNDLSGATRFGNVADASFHEIQGWKSRIADEGAFFSPCAACDDTYRHVLLLRPRLLEGDPT